MDPKKIDQIVRTGAHSGLLNAINHRLGRAREFANCATDNACEKFAEMIENAEKELADAKELHAELLKYR